MSETQPQVSVIIPTYNCARYLPEAIDSVLAQTYRDFEIIVVDDGSTDDTPDVLARYGEAILVIRQPNQGRGAARNAGILAARGQYIAFLDADDLWLPEKLEKQVALLRARAGAGWVYSDHALLDANGGRGEGFLRLYGIRPAPDGGRMLPALLKACVAQTGTVVVRAECFRKVGLFDVSFRRSQDYDMWIRLACHFETACVDEVLALYRQHAGQELSRPRPGFVEHYHWRVLDKFMRQYRPQLPLSLRRKSGLAAREALAWFALRAGQAAVMRRSWLAAVRWHGRACSVLLGDRGSCVRLLPWVLGQALDGVLPATAMRALRRVKRVLLPTGGQ
jgi:GT2 family glycosyltransferase